MLASRRPSCGLLGCGAAFVWLWRSLKRGRTQCLFVEYPLHGVIEKRQKRLVHDRPVEPKVNAGNGRILDVRQTAKGGVGGGDLRAYEMEECLAGDVEDVGFTGIAEIFVGAASGWPAIGRAECHHCIVFDF